MSAPEQEIQPPDPKARRQAMLILVWSAAIGSICVLGISRSEAELQALLEAWLPTLVRHPWLPAAANLLLASPVIFLSVYLYRFGARTVAAERYPPPGMAVTKPTRVLRGGAARRRGRWVQILCLALILAVGGMSLALWRIFAMLAGMA